MLEKIKSLISLKFVKRFYKRCNKPITLLIGFYLFLIVIIIMSLYFLCAYDWANGKAVFANLLLLLDKCVSAPFVAALAFAGGAFIDTDNDGIPDSFDKHDDRPSETKQEPRRRE